MSLLPFLTSQTLIVFEVGVYFNNTLFPSLLGREEYTIR